LCASTERDVRQVTQESLRRNVGVVQQDVFLFADSVLENIRYGRPDASEEEVIRAARLAEIYDDIVSLPDGFDTYVGERGTLLSGGQKQRISIARIFLKDPPGADSGRGHLRSGQRDGGQDPERPLKSWPGAAPPSSSPTDSPPFATPTASR
jgi:ABC-type hemin transport system ATPase subunit